MLGRRRKAHGEDSPHEILAEMAGAGAALAASRGDGDRIFRTIFDRVGVGIWQSTPAGHYMRINPRCAEIMGYESPAAAAAAIQDIGRQIYVDPAERERFKASLAAEGRVSGFVAQHRRRDGSVFWARLSAVSVQGANGMPAFYIGSVEDVSVLIDIQEQLRGAERDYREIWENAAEGIYRSSPEGRQLRANPALVRLNGYSSEAEMLARVNDIASEWYADPGRREEFKRLLGEHGRIHDFESEICRHKTRERIWISENAWEVRDAQGRLLYYEGTARDITARRRAEQRIREAGKRFRDFADASSDWFWESDAEHRMSFISDNIRRFGVEPDKLLGRARWEFAEPEQAEFWRQHRETLNRSEPFRDHSYRIKTAGGVTQVIAISGKPVFDAKGRFRGYRGTGRVITDQVRQQELLRLSEERFRDFAEASSDWYWETDANHVCTYISDAIRQVRGDPATVVGKKRHDLPIAPEEDPERWRRHLTVMDRHEPFREFVYKIPGVDGQTQSIAVSGKPVFGAGGAFKGYRGTGRLISEQVQQQELLRASEERFRDYADTASDWFWESGREHRFTFLSPSARRPNVRDQTVIGQRRWDYADDIHDEPEKWEEHRAVLARHEPFRNFVFRMRNDKGEAEYIAASGKPIFDAAGEFQGYRGSARRITEQMHQEALLRESEERFRDYAATASDWFWETDEEHRFISFSESLRVGLGDPVAGIGKRRWELALDAAEEPAKWERHREQLALRAPFRDFAYRICTSDGAENFIAVSGMPVFDEKGRFKGYRGSARIVTDAIHQEERLREAKTQAEAASATKSAFLANMSHELRTPLNAIIGFSEIMNREMFGKIGVPRYIDYLKDIGDSAQHLLRLIGDILDLSKAEAGKMEIEENEVDLAASIHSACLMLRERAKRGSVALEEEVAADLPRLFGDRRRIRQVLLNFVSNAVKFTPRGGSVSVSAAANAEGGLVLSVIDTGIGIEAEDIPRVFEPFVQLGRDKGISGEGTGLGLPLCKELVELHGGTISLTSQPGAGTTVRAVFPPARTVAKRAAA